MVWHLILQITVTMHLTCSAPHFFTVLGLRRGVPSLKITASFDHFIGLGKQHGWHGEIERLGGLEVDE
jgi:hypothetical protein